MDNFVDTFLLKLPREILVLIFSYIPKSFDTIQLLNVHPSLKNALQDFAFIKSIDFNNEYRLNLENWMSIFKNDLTHIVSFNINNVYWIPVEEIRNGVKEMLNLSDLFAMDTEFVANKENCLFVKTHLLKLEVLAISISWSDFDGNTINDLPPLKTLYVHINENTRMRNVPDISKGFEKFLSYLVFVDDNAYPEFTTRFEHYNHSPQRSIQFDKNRTKWEELLKNTIGFNPEKEDRIPFGMADIKKIQRNNYSLDNVMLQEFSFRDCDNSDIDCTSYNYTLQQDLLCSEKAKHLKKLSIQFCTIFDDVVESFFNEKSPKKLKREDCTFRRIIRNCSTLEEIEISNCKKYNNHYINNFGKVLPYDINDNPNLEKRFIEELNQITNLNNLKKLSLINIPFSVAKYDCLEIILKECKKLEYLDVTISFLQSSVFENKLFFSLPYATQLRDLRFIDTGFCTNSLLSVLNNAEFPKLQRLYCSNTSRISEDILRKFLERNPQLIFFAIHNFFSTLMKTEMENIQKVMDEYKRDKQKVFCIGNSWAEGGGMFGGMFSGRVDPFTLKMDAPAIHKKDLIQKNTNVCVYNYFEDTSLIKSLYQ